MKVRIPFVTTLLLSIFLLGCEDDTTVPMEAADKELTPQEFFRSQFTLDNFEDPSGHVVVNIEIDRNDYQTKTFNEKTWYEFKAIQHQPTEILGKDRIRGSFYSLLAYKDGDGSKMYLNKMLSYSDGEGFTYFNIADKYYHGMVYLYNLEGEVEHLFHFQKGNLKHSVENIKLETTETDALGLIARGECHQKASTARCDSALACALGDVGSACGSGGAASGGYVSVTTHYYTDWYNNRGGALDYSHTQYNGSSSEWVWMSSNSGSSGYANTSYNYAVGSTNQEGYTSVVKYTSTKPKNAESPTYKIILDKSLKDNEKANCVYKKLSFTNSMKDLLVDFFGDDAEFNLTLKLVPNLNCGESDSPNGCTTANYDYRNKNIVISLDEGFVNNYSLLVIGKTFIHEVIHANLFLAVKKLNGGVIPKDKDFESLYEKYRSLKGWQHDFMADNYVDIIAEALKEFHSVIDDSVFKNYYSDWDWDDFYTKLAWTGLKNTVKGKDYFEKNTAQISIFYEAAKVNSTKKQICNFKE